MLALGGNAMTNADGRARPEDQIAAAEVAMAAVAELIEHMEVLALGNLDPHIHFAILGDFADAPSAVMPEDEQILDADRAVCGEAGPTWSSPRPSRRCTRKTRSRSSR